MHLLMLRGWLSLLGIGRAFYSLAGLVGFGDRGRREEDNVIMTARL